ncbi:MAG: glycosyltransferase family 4 protein [Candidatus Peregrinibacteria bacterium]|nr:glycosyltransferase family 4 protein [Candidatus Peregrinibacteria bacterium]
MKTILLISPYWKEEHRWMVSTVKLAELWQRIGYRVIVVCMGASSSVEEVSPTLTIHRRKDIFLPDPWNYGICFGFAGYVRRVVEKEKPNIILVNKILFWTSLSLISLRLRGYRVSLLTDALVGMTWWGRTFLFRLSSRIYAWTLGWLTMLSAYRFVTFHPQPEKLLKFLRVAHKTRVIPTGIDPTPYVPAQNPHAEKIMVTYVGRLESVKGVDDYLAAVVPLMKEFPNITVQVVGWYKEDHPLVSQYEKDVIFTGLRKDIPAILGSSDIFVLPSYSEGLSNALMEAMASGCACIATEVGGNCFLIQNGVSGFHYPPGDRAMLAAHVRRLLEDPAKRASMGKAARKRIEEHFSWDSVGKQYREFFEEIAEGNREPGTGNREQGTE